MSAHVSRAVLPSANVVSATELLFSILFRASDSKSTRGKKEEHDRSHDNRTCACQVLMWLCYMLLLHSATTVVDIVYQDTLINRDNPRYTTKELRLV